MDEQKELYEFLGKTIEKSCVIIGKVGNDDINCNRQFLLIRNKDDLNILFVYDLKSLSLLDSLKFNNAINYFDFHSHYEIIFFVCIEKNVIIYEINRDNKKLIELSTIKGQFNQIDYASFSPIEPNYFLSLSTNKEIKIYDIRKSLPISHIFLDKYSLIQSQIKWGKTNIAVQTTNNDHFYSFNNIIVINEFQEYLKENISMITLNEVIVDFHFYDDFYDTSLIVLTEQDIKFVLTKDDIRTIYSIENIDNCQNYNNYYYKKKHILILFFLNEIRGLNILSYNNAKEVFIFKVCIVNPFFIHENCLEENELCSFFSFSFSHNKFCSIIINSPNNTEKKINNISDEKIKDFINKAIKVIIDIPLLLSKNNNKENNYINNKKYFNYKEIQNELDIIKKRNLFKRKEEVINNVDKINSINDIEKKYIFILKLIVNDNTNIDLILKYLIFLKENEEKLKIIFNNDIEEYKSELEYYINIINNEDANKYFFKTKASQKSKLFEFMENILKIDKNHLDTFKDYLNSYNDFYEKTIYYNMPIEFSNEEFIYFGYLNLLKYHLKCLNFDIKQMIEYNIKVEKDEEKRNTKENEIYGNELEFLKYKISRTLKFIEDNPKDIKRIEYLIILTVQTTDKDEYNFGFNLINSKNNTSNDIIKFNENSKNLKIKVEEDRITLYQIKDDNNKKDKNEIKENNKTNERDKKEKNKINEDRVKIEKMRLLNNYSQICLDNLNIYSNNEYFSKKIYNYDYYKKKHAIKYNLDLVKKFYKNVLPSTCFKSIYSTLYGEDAFYPFEDKKFTSDFIDKNYDYLPLKNEKGLGITSKFSMKTYVISFFPKVEGGYCNKLFKKLLRTAVIVKTSNNEFGHNFVNIHFFMENSRISNETSRKKTLDFVEGSGYIELALYGRLLENISLEQAFYILNESNYNKNFIEFQEGFNNIQQKDLEIKGTFEEVFKDINLEEINSKQNKNIYIPQKDANKNRKIYINCRIKNDVIGRRCSHLYYDEIYQKYM